MFVCLHTNIDTNIYASVCLEMHLNAAQMQLHLRPNTATIVNQYRKESWKKKNSEDRYRFIDFLKFIHSLSLLYNFPWYGYVQIFEHFSIDEYSGNFLMLSCVLLPF